MKSFSGRQTAMIAYIPFVGFLIAFSINREVKSALATWHVKNMFGLFILFFAALVIQARVHLLAGDLLWFFSLILWIYSFVMATRGKKKAIPVLSDQFQKWFSFLN